MNAVAAASAIAVFLNGTPVNMTPPPVEVKSVIYVAARPLFEALGAKLRYDPDTRVVYVDAPGRSIEIGVGCEKAMVNERVVPIGGTAQTVGGALIVPLRFAATCFGADVKWDGAARAVHITLPPAAPPKDVTIAEIVDAAEEWEGKAVIITGEYRGWRGDGFYAAVSHGPAETRSDWVVRDATGDIYCTANAPVKSDIRLGPTEELGRRIVVQGTVAIAKSGHPFIRPTRVTARTGIEGLICLIESDSPTYKPAQVVSLQVTVKNPFDQPVTLTFTSSQRYDFVVLRDTGGEAGKHVMAEVWRWSAGRGFAEVMGELTLAGGESKTFKDRWPQLDAEGSVVAWGLYRVGGEVNPQVKSYPITIQIERAAPRPLE